MTLAAAAIVPHPPLLIPEIAGIESAAADEELRAACDAAVQTLVAAGVDVISVVGTAPHIGPLPVESSYDWSGFGVRARRPVHRLPLALGVGAWLLDRAGYQGPRSYFGVTSSMHFDDVARLGDQLARRHDRVGLLVCGDGSARRTEKAPGHFDRRAEVFDQLVEQAVAAADSNTLLSLREDIAEELLVAGRAPWQALAAAWLSAPPGRTTIRFSGAPYGVWYLVADWLPTSG